MSEPKKGELMFPKLAAQLEKERAAGETPRTDAVVAASEFESDGAALFDLTNLCLTLEREMAEHKIHWQADVNELAAARRVADELKRDLAEATKRGDFWRKQAEEWDERTADEQKAAEARLSSAGAPVDPEHELEAPETPGTWQERCVALYQVVGSLADFAGVFESSDDVSDALDVAAGRGEVGKLLPWPKAALQAAPQSAIGAPVCGWVDYTGCEKCGATLREDCGAKPAVAKWAGHS